MELLAEKKENNDMLPQFIQKSPDLCGIKFVYESQKSSSICIIVNQTI